MTLAKWASLFLSTIGLGMAAALAAGIAVFAFNPEVSAAGMRRVGIGYNLMQTLIVGALLGAFSHMGFFAYLVTNYFAQSIFRNRPIWLYIQVFLIVAVAFYSVALRVPPGGSVLPFLPLPLLVFAGAAFVTRWKVKETGARSLIPTLFFMTAVTLLEAVPALRQYNAFGTLMMVLPLFVCNAWQILRLHRVVKPSPAPGPERERPSAA